MSLLIQLPLGRYVRRPIAKAELDREVERLKARR